jgi:hypothetical protein
MLLPSSYLSWTMFDGGFIARIATPCVPKSAALPACGAPENVSQRSRPNVTSASPASSMIVCHSASSRAPAIQPVQRSIFSFADCGTAFSSAMSAI